MVGFLKPKKKMRFACWNIRTLYQTSKLVQVVRELDNYNLDILGISEARWTGTGKRQLPSGHAKLYSGRTDNRHAEGVAIIYRSKLKKTLIEWKPMGTRLVTAKFNSRYTKLTIISCYASIVDAEKEEEATNARSDQLQEATHILLAHDMLLVIGNLNARVHGNGNTGRESNMGTHRCGITNDNGQRLCKLYEENKLVIGGPFFIIKKSTRKPGLHWTGSPSAR